MNAGILFRTGNKVLAGKKRTGEWSGIGGKVEAGETAKFAAIREALEEIYGVYTDEETIGLLAKSTGIEQSMSLLYTSAEYVLYELPLGALGQIARRINSAKLYAKNYRRGVVPPNMAGIVSEFIGKGELRALKIITFNDIEDATMRFGKYFVDDLKYIINELS